MNHLRGIARRALGRELRLEPRLPAVFEDEVGGLEEVVSVVEAGQAADAPVAPPAMPAAGEREGSAGIGAAGRETAVLREVARSAPAGEGGAAAPAPAPEGRPAAPLRREPPRSRTSIRQDPGRHVVERVETMLASVPPEARERLLRADPARHAPGPPHRLTSPLRATDGSAAARPPAAGRREATSPDSGPGLSRIARRAADDSRDGRDGEHPSAPVVEVTIGRVEVRAAPPPATAARRTAAERRPALDLESYLRERARSS